MNLPPTPSAAKPGAKAEETCTLFALYAPIAHIINCTCLLPSAAKPGAKAEETFYDSLKKDMAARASATRQLLDTLDPATRLAMEGHRPGTYVRLRFSGG